MKKMITMLLALVLILGLAVPVMAADTVSVSITHIADNHTYTAYQIFDGKLDGATLSDIKWGANVNGPALLEALRNDTTVIYNSDKTQSAQFSVDFASATTAADVVKVLSGYTSDGERLEHFAKVVTKYLTGTGVSNSTPVTDNGNGTYTYIIEGLDPGYYLIDDVTTDANVGAEDFRTHYILSLTTHTSLTTKGHYPTVDKSVSETLDGTYTEWIANQLNKLHYFKWDVAIDDRISEFTTYYLGFDDVMQKGLSFNQLEEVYILEADNTKEYLYRDGAWTADAEPDVNTVTTGTAGIRLNGDDYTADDTYMVLAWNDLKDAFPGLAGDDHLVVKYSAYLNEDAIYGDPMENDVFIKFSNGPDADDYGYSVPDYAFVFSFGMKVLKVDADNSAVVLPGAEFLLYHKHGDVKHYAYVVNGEAVAWTPYTTDEEVEAAKAAIDADASLSDEEKAEAKAKVYKATTLVTDTNGNIHVNGLDEDTLYFLHEAKAPEGYNTLFTDVEFSIHPAYTTVSGEPKVSSITYTVDGHSYTLSEGEDFEAGRVVVTVVNNKGNTLPSTGGIGTTIFYLLGGMMAAAAVVLLVTKKRMSAMN